MLTKRKIYTAANLMEAHHVKNLLQLEAIDCVLKGEALAGALGELPVNFCEIEVLVEPRYEATARTIVESYVANLNAPIDHWRCRDCGEENPSTYEVCWNCQTDAVEL